MNSDYKAVPKYYKISISLAGHRKEKLIKKSAELIYMITKKDIEKTLFGEHMLANTINGERIKININKQISDIKETSSNR